MELPSSDDPSDPSHVGGVLIPAIDLQDGDSIVVDQVVDLSDGFYVTITGMVAQADTFPWREGLTLRDLVELARGPITGADLRHAEISRLPDERSLGSLVVNERELEWYWPLLKPIERDILFLWAVEGLSFTEVAVELNMARGTILSAMHRMRGRLSVDDKTAQAALNATPQPV